MDSIVKGELYCVLIILSISSTICCLLFFFAVISGTYIDPVLVLLFSISSYNSLNVIFFP